MKVTNLDKEIRRIRLEKRMSLIDFADLCGLTYQGLQNIERGGSVSVRESTIAKIEQGTGYTAHFHGSEIRFVKPQTTTEDLDPGIKEIMEKHKDDPQFRQLLEALQYLTQDDKELILAHINHMKSVRRETVK